MEKIFQEILLDIQNNASTIELLRYSIMTEEQQYQELEKKTLEYLSTTDSLPKKKYAHPITAKHNGRRFQIDF